MDEVVERKIRYIADISGMKYNTVRALVKSKVADLEFFINDHAAVHIIAKDLGIELPKKFGD